MQGFINSAATVAVALGLFTVLCIDGGCATSFTGSARVEGGAAGCQRKCSADGLHFAGMVHMGEYSNACVCTVDPSPAGVQKAIGGATAAGVGVMLQTRAAQQQAAH